jgi:RNA polymerase sigma factor (sigma-70 family)
VYILDAQRNDYLIRQLAAGDMGALSELYTETDRAVFAYALSIVNNYALAEDVMQEVFIKIRLCAGSYKASTNPNGWIMTITRNAALDMLKKLKREVSIDEMYMHSYAAEDDVDLIFMKEALEKLKQSERQIVTLYLINDISQKDIARHLRLPLTTVKWRYRAALKKLSSLIEE